MRAPLFFLLLAGEPDSARGTVQDLPRDPVPRRGATKSSHTGMAGMQRIIICALLSLEHSEERDVGGRMSFRVIAILAIGYSLSGCTSFIKAFGHDFTDPQKTMVLMQLYSPNGATFDSAGFRALTTAEDHTMLKSYPQKNGCMTMVSVFDAGKYELVSLYYNNMNRGGNFYKFNPGDPDNLTFEVGSGDLVYIGAYEVGSGEKSGTFSFAPTEHCGDEEKAITEYDAHAMDHLLFRNTVWPERFDEKMKDF